MRSGATTNDTVNVYKYRCGYGPGTCDALGWPAAVLPVPSGRLGGRLLSIAAGVWPGECDVALHGMDD